MIVDKSIFYFLTLVSILSFTFDNYALGTEKDSGLIAPGAALKIVQSRFNGTEGPATDADGNVYFTDIHAERIYKWTWKDGKVNLYREDTGMANGMMFDSEGNLVICEMGNGRIVRDDLKGNVTVIADSLNGEKLRGPNDLWIDPKGGIYFSHTSMGGSMPGRGMPGSGAPGGEMPSGGMPQDSGQSGGGMPGGSGPGAPGGGDTSDLGIVYISPDGKKVTRVIDTEVSNGIIGTPDGKTLYIGGDQRKIWSYKINPDGTVTDKKVFCDQVTDGMAMDEKNNLYITGDESVLIYSPNGELLEEIVMPEGCSNVEFCGKERKTLFITYHENIYTLEMNVKGAPTALDLARGNR